MFQCIVLEACQHFSDGDNLKCPESPHKQRKATELNLVKQNCALKEILVLIFFSMGGRGK